jgi:hypothetical protein
VNKHNGVLIEISGQSKASGQNKEFIQVIRQVDKQCQETMMESQITIVKKKK